MMDAVSRLWAGQAEGSSRAVLVASTTLATTLSLYALLRYALYPPRRQVLPSPLLTVLPRLSKQELDSLPYTPDAFPGARDVPTPYGSIRVYEFGPVTGRKVLFIHGISTACQTLGPVARGLAAPEGGGCRVMLFDLFGRGFSDGVGDLPHDARLYVSQALLALASSPLAWTGGGAALHLVGYSMGGGVAVHLANALPRAAVAGLVLLAPAGLIRPASFGAVTRWVFTSGWLPEPLLAALTRRRLQRPLAASARPRSGAAAAAAAEKEGGEGAGAPRREHHHPGSPVAEAAALAASEAADPRPGAAGPADPLERRVLRYVQWMATHHEGFIPAFTSSLRFAPLLGQEAAWRGLASRPGGTTRLLVVVGRDDEIVHPDDLAADALPLLGGRGAAGVAWEVLAGGHDFPMTNAEGTLRVIREFWGLEAGGQGAQ